MRSATLPSFWDTYQSLDDEAKRRASKAFRLWAQNPFHPSLHFKCINRPENLWSVRVSRGLRALGILDGGTVTRFWIGDHDEYDRSL